MSFDKWWSAYGCDASCYVRGWKQYVKKAWDFQSGRITELEKENEKLKANTGLECDWVEIDGERVYTSYNSKLKARVEALLEENAQLMGYESYAEQLQQESE